MRSWVLRGCDWYPFRYTRHIYLCWRLSSVSGFGAWYSCEHCRFWLGSVNAFWDLRSGWEMGYVLLLALIGLSSGFFFDVGRLDTLFLLGWFFVDIVLVVVEACYKIYCSVWSVGLPQHNSGLSLGVNFFRSELWWFAPLSKLRNR